MTDIRRRRILQGMALGGLATTGCSGGSKSGSNDNTTAPDNDARELSPWLDDTPGSLPSEGLAPTADFSFPIRTTLPFAHGVASGDPLPEQIIIWTRITLESYPDTIIDGEWRMATDKAMTNIVARGAFDTNADRDWTVKIDVASLSPYTVYYYQFYYDGAESCIGRTRTAPAEWDNQDHIRFAVCACSSYFSGQMNGYGRIADRKDIDFVIHCGDYIYDFPDSDESFRIPSGNDDGDTNPDFRGPRTLNELRRRYALYRSDPNLFRAHQQHPWLILWDNHDVGANDELTDQESFQAFWEWTPSRQAFPNDIYRRHDRISYGAMADIFFTDRHYTRWFDDEAQPNREYLGVSQNEWFREELLNSQHRSADWRIVINQAFIGQFYLINAPASIDWILELVVPDYSDGIILNSNQWDGAQQERTDLINFLADNEIRNNLFVTGDMHMNWASDVAADPGSYDTYNPDTGEGSWGIEFAPSSISRGGADENVRGALGGTDAEGASFAAYLASGAVSNVLANTNPNAQYMEWTNHGYGIVDMKPDLVTMEYWWTQILKETNHEILGAQMISAKDSNHMVRLTMPVATQRDSEQDAALADEINEALLFQTV